MNIAVFGATSFIGRALCESLLTHGHSVISFSRRAPETRPNASHRHWALGERPIIDKDDHVNVAIHLAHDFTRGTGADLNVYGTVAAVQACAASAVPRQIYFSSYSAHRHATSVYGRAKYVTEQILNGFTDLTIVRPGLVVGNGGVYLKIEKLARRLPFFPTISGLNKVIPIIELDLLITTVTTILSVPKMHKEYNIFHPGLLSLYDLLLYAQQDRHVQAVSKFQLVIPRLLVLYAVHFLLLSRIPIGNSLDSILGLISNAQSPHTSMWVGAT